MKSSCLAVKPSYVFNGFIPLDFQTPAGTVGFFAEYQHFLTWYLDVFGAPGYMNTQFKSTQCKSVLLIKLRSPIGFPTPSQTAMFQ